jgi:hypothetical protein
MVERAFAVAPHKRRYTDTSFELERKRDKIIHSATLLA